MLTSTYPALYPEVSRSESRNPQRTCPENCSWWRLSAIPSRYLFPHSHLCLLMSSVSQESGVLWSTSLMWKTPALVWVETAARWQSSQERAPGHLLRSGLWGGTSNWGLRSITLRPRSKPYGPNYSQPWVLLTPALVSETRHTEFSTGVPTPAFGLLHRIC